MPRSPGTLLCITPFKSTRGYAWDLLGKLNAAMADHLATHGIPTLVAYPEMPAPPPALAGSAARAIQLDGRLETAESVRATSGLIQRENVKVICSIANPAWSWSYLRLRRAGVRCIIVYDHNSGEYTRPRGLRRLAKWLLVRVPGVVADVVVAVSEFVARRQIEAGLIPPHRVVTIRNGLPTVETQGGSQRVRATFAVPAERPLVVCNCRATPEKGVHHLLRAFELVARSPDLSGKRPFLLYVGDGPQLPELQALRETLTAKEDILLAGFRADAREILEGADMCVVPSVWQDALPFAVMEGMARGKPVIATRVGGIPEMIEDGVSGVLVPPADEAALAAALAALLSDPCRAAALGQAARQRVAEHFTPQQQVRRLTALVEAGFGTPCKEVSG
ncbi:MAG: glycosyltransferase family 4 protein [Acidobacteriia bacterium]|nr:glycosyltransferase family 4 protein [Terriglobia bacterium]